MIGFVIKCVNELYWYDVLLEIVFSTMHIYFLQVV